MKLSIIFLLILALVVLITIAIICNNYNNNKLMKKNLGTDYNYFTSKKYSISNNIIPVNDKYKDIKIYCLNLLNRPDRKKHMLGLFKKLHFTNYKFVVPIDPKLAKSNIFFKDSYLPPSKCSHALTTLNILQNNTDDVFFILEDDIELYSDKNINEMLDSAFSYPFDLLYLEFCDVDCTSIKKLNEHLYSLNDPLCTGIILYTKKFSDILINEYINNNNNTLKYRSYDNVLRKKAKKHTFIGYPLFKQNPLFGSDLKRFRKI